MFRVRVQKLASTALAVWLVFESTAYCLPGLTKTETPVRYGIISVDPKVIPLGSWVEIEGLGLFHAEDTGRSIKGNRIDIWLPNKGWCRNWGRRKVKIRVIKEGRA